MRICFKQFFENVAAYGFQKEKIQVSNKPIRYSRYSRPNYLSVSMLIVVNKNINVAHN